MRAILRADISRKKKRIGLSVASIALVITLFLIIEALSGSFFNSFFSHLYNTQAEVWVSPSMSFSGIGGTYTEKSLQDDVESIDGVASSEPVITLPSRARKDGIRTNVTIVGFAAGGEYEKTAMASGRMPRRGKSEAAVDESLVARMPGLKPGNSVVVMGRSVRIVGVTRGHNLIAAPVMFLEIDNARDILELDDKDLSYLLVQPKAGASGAVIARETQKKLGRKYRVQTKDEVIAEWRRQMSYITSVLNFVIGISFLIGTMVIAVTIYTSVIERVREFGILKALGATNWYVSRLVILEGLAIAVPGLIIGCLIGAGVALSIPLVMPMDIAMDAGMFLRAALASIGISILGSLIGLRRAAQVDPIIAIRTV